ncbi:hypothetical protein CK203_025324 [Vitis vinifera]|uniref:Uncharacterized protein n=1 Tax=Vitis vinifera TaxID=29760 RepID=A0A438IZJ5_VITVI|nr:hypothetical protein CK203_025324 [Vitis vinifera]
MEGSLKFYRMNLSLYVLKHSWLVSLHASFKVQVGTALDTIEQLSEEQSLDPLFSEK